MPQEKIAGYYPFYCSEKTRADDDKYDYSYSFTQSKTHLD